MKLNRVEIENYRSIKDQSVRFNPTCRVLVGVNESGKSNVLNALATLSNTFSTSPSDERQQLPDEQTVSDQSEIRFVFSFEKADYDSALTSITQSILAKPSSKVMNDGNKDLTFLQLLKTFSEGLYTVDVRKGFKRTQYWKRDKTKAPYVMIGDWYIPSNECPEDFLFTTAEGDKVSLKEKELIKLSPSEKDSIPTEYIRVANKEDILMLVINHLLNHVEENLPETIFWEYRSQDLLPTQISLTKFISQPDMYIPLKNMFLLAGIENIADEIKREKSKGVTQLNNLLKRVALSATKYLKDVWQEYKGVRFSLQMNGPNIQCTISEENDFPFKDRSDGFKKFIAFLLSVSSTTHTGKLQNALILIDEPETGLHPSGIRYLRDELLKVSLTNYVIYSTHSIFMIDRHNIARHLITSKKREVTSLQEGNSGNIVDEEVIFNAINYSTFEHLNEVNILFEGWRDKKLFRIYTKSYKKAYFNNIGVGHGSGVTSFRSLIPTIEIAERKAVIISDNDNVAKQAKKHFMTLRHNTAWKTYKDISPTTTAITGEDFLKNDFIVETFRKITADSGQRIILAPNTLPLDDKISYLKTILLSNGRTDTKANAEIESLKVELFENLTKPKIEDRYIVLIDDIQKYIDSELR